jgi:predicted transcriptional regulator
MSNFSLLGIKMASSVDMSREELLNCTKDKFRGAGYSLSDEEIYSPSFDFIAKKPNLLLPAKPIKILIRVIAELDLFKKQRSLELQLIAKLIQGNPLLIAEFASGKRIRFSTLYRRHNVPAISLQTLHLFLMNESIDQTNITKYAHRGGIYVNLSTRRFIERRKKLELDIRKLSEKIGISRQSLYNYEKGISSPKIESYSRIMNVMGDDLEHQIEIFKQKDDQIDFSTFKTHYKPRSQLQKEISGYLEEKDVEVLWFRSEPFDGLSVDDTQSTKEKQNLKPANSIITGVSSTDGEKNINRQQLLNKLSQFLGKRAIWFDEKELDIDTQTFKGTKLFTVLSISELERMGHEEFLHFLKPVPTSHTVKTKNPTLDSKPNKSK